MWSMLFTSVMQRSCQMVWRPQEGLKVSNLIWSTSLTFWCLRQDLGCTFEGTVVSKEGTHVTKIFSKCTRDCTIATTTNRQGRIVWFWRPGGRGGWSGQMLWQNLTCCPLHSQDWPWSLSCPLIWIWTRVTFVVRIPVESNDQSLNKQWPKRCGTTASQPEGQLSLWLLACLLHIAVAPATKATTGSVSLLHSWSPVLFQVMLAAASTAARVSPCWRLREFVIWSHNGWIHWKSFEVEKVELNTSDFSWIEFETVWNSWKRLNLVCHKPRQQHARFVFEMNSIELGWMQFASIQLSWI